MRKIQTAALLAVTILVAGTTWAEDHGDQATETAPTAQSQTQPPKLKLREDFWYHLAATPAYALWQINLHEGTHAVAGMMSGLQVRSYKGYPHTYHERNGSRHLTFGRVVFDGQTDRGNLGLIASAPMMLEAGMFISSDVMIGQINRDSYVAPFIWFGGMVWPLTHFILSTLSSDETDLKLVTYSLDMNYDLGVAAAVAIGTAGLLRTVYRGHQVLMVEEDDETNADVAIVPIIGYGYQGLSFQGSF